MKVYRESMNPAEQERVAPAWPDFVVLRDRDQWFAVTNAGRPGLPYFWMSIGEDPDLPDELLVATGRARLDNAYQKAHPNGHPGSH